MEKKIFLIVFIISFSIFQQCRPQTEIPTNLNSMLLYIEDLDGIGGSSNGGFSDIVAFAPSTSKQYILTSDVYWDNYPTYSSKTKKVYFESKRENIQPAVGLTAASHIYELDLSFKKKSLVDNKILRKIFSLKDWEELQSPLINNGGDKLLFQYNWGDYKNEYDRLILYNIKNNTYDFLYDSLYFSFRYVFSENDSVIAFESQTNTRIRNRTKYIGMIDVKTKRRKVFIIENNIENKLGDYKFNKILYSSKRWDEDVSRAVLTVYDITAKEKYKVTIVMELGFKEIKYPVFKDANSIYFIGSKESKNPDTFDEDIYLLNLQTKEMKQITFTHNIKDNLRYYE